MSADTIPQRSNGQTIDATWYNIFRTVLSQDQVPRNASAVATDQGGSLGTSSYRWLNAYMLGLLLYNGSRSIRVEAPSGMGSDYSLILPGAPPVSGSKILFIDSTGQASVTVAEDNSTIEVSGTELRIKDGGITRAKLADIDHTITSSCGAFSTSSEALITNFSVTKTVSGRPVFIGVISDGSGNDSYIEGSGGSAVFRIKRDGVTLATHLVGSSIKHPVSQLTHIDPVAAGTYTWTINLVGAGGSTANLAYAKMVVYEM